MFYRLMSSTTKQVTVELVIFNKEDASGLHKHKLTDQTGVTFARKRSQDGIIIPDIRKCIRLFTHINVNFVTEVTHQRTA